MEVLLYSDHHHLPGSDRPQQPSARFLPDGNQLTGREWLLPVLRGLFLVEGDDLLAHVSVLGDAKRAWVRITTMPKETDNRDLPLVVRRRVSHFVDDPDNKTPEDVLNVELLWGIYSGGHIRSPYDILPSNYRDSKVADTPEFWQTFFLGALSPRKW